MERLLEGKLAEATKNAERPSGKSIPLSQGPRGSWDVLQEPGL